MTAVALDRRTRSDADVRQLTPEAVFGDVLPALLERNGTAARAAIEELHPRPLAIEVGLAAWTIGVASDRLIITEGVDDEALVVSFDEQQLSDFAQQLRSLNAMQVAHELVTRGGSLRDVAIWDAVWLTLLEGWPAVDPALSFVDRDGEPLDLRHAFTMDDDPGEIAHFLREAGYLHLRGWLDAADMATIADDIDRALPTYREDDGRSWWATANGARRCVRLQHFVEHSPTIERILSSEQWDALRQTLAGDDDLRQGPVEGNCVEALVKPLGVTEGISDVPWHRDCNFGRHAYMCSGTIIGISVTPGVEESGQLRAVAGSHRVAMPSLFAFDRSYLPVVPLPTEAGDLTVHLGCTLHEAMPPMRTERKVLYTGFKLAPREGDDAAGGGAIANLRERAHRLVSQPASPVAQA